MFSLKCTEVMLKVKSGHTENLIYLQYDGQPDNILPSVMCCICVCVIAAHTLFVHTFDKGVSVATPSGVNVIPVDLITLRSTDLHVCFFFNLEVVCYGCKALIWVTAAKHEVPLLSSSPPHDYIAVWYITMPS